MGSIKAIQKNTEKNMKEFTLKVIVFKRDDAFEGICLDLDIAIRAKSEQEFRCKLNDAILSYLRTFTKEEILRGDFFRLAPMRYQFLWHLKALLRLTKKEKFYEPSYNTETNHLSFA